jgi:hypothetical protein
VLDDVITADVPEVELIASGRSKTVSKAVHAPPADGPCRNARRSCVGVNLISADGARRVPVAVSVRAYALVANRARRSAVAVTVGADVLATDPACRVAVSISVGVDRAAVLSPARIARSICVKSALGVQWKNGNGQHERCKNEARHRPSLLLLVSTCTSFAPKALRAARPECGNHMHDTAKRHHTQKSQQT